MKLLRFVLALSTCACVAPLSFAQAPKGEKAPKSPADTAVDDFLKLYGDREAKVDQARIQKLVKGGLELLEKYPTQRKIPDVIKAVSTYPAVIVDKKVQAAVTLSYLAALKYEVVNSRQKDGLTDDARAAVAALEAAVADFDTRLSMSRDNVANLREKIDTLAGLPSGGRFLAAAEKGYFEVLAGGVSGRAAEAHLNKLLESPEKSVATMAREELNLVEVRKAPYELKFTALDGKAVDVAAYRGKVVALVFFSATNEGSKKNLDAVRDVHALYKKNLEVVAVSFDKEADREKLTAYLKDAKLGWPVHYDGKEAKNEWSPKLNVKRAPALVVFDPKGMLVNNNLPTNQLEAAVRKLSGIK